MQSIERAIFGGGCFWCVEAMFQKIVGVHKVTNGYTGGEGACPTYEEVCQGNTNHAEVVEIKFDKEQISYDQLLHLFFLSHDPTTLNRQGNDTGTQYRSCIYAVDQTQYQQAINKIQQCQSLYQNPIVTQVLILKQFYPAEDYHQNYYNLNYNTNMYCKTQVSKKIQKFIDTINSNNLNHHLNTNL